MSGGAEWERVSSLVEGERERRRGDIHEPKKCGENQPALDLHERRRGKKKKGRKEKREKRKCCYVVCFLFFNQCY